MMNDEGGKADATTTKDCVTEYLVHKQKSLSSWLAGFRDEWPGPGWGRAPCPKPHHAYTPYAPGEVKTQPHRRNNECGMVSASQRDWGNRGGRACRQEASRVAILSSLHCHRSEGAREVVHRAKGRLGRRIRTPSQTGGGANKCSPRGTVLTRKDLLNNEAFRPCAHIAQPQGEAFTFHGNPGLMCV
jgi:hypothetical protein